MRRGPLVVVGDTLLDRDLEARVDRLCPDAPAPVVEEVARRSRPGGAGLAAALAAMGDREVVLLTALSRDRAGEELAGMLDRAGVAVVDLGLDGPTPEKVRMLAGDRCVFRLDRNCTDPAPIADEDDDDGRAEATIGAAAAVLVSDYGRGVATVPAVRRAVARLAARVPVVWDPHPRGKEPVAGSRLVTPNRAEAARLASGIEGDGLAALTARARVLRDRWKVAAIAVTLGKDGALVVEDGGPPLMAPARQVHGDTCGAGDRFASTSAMLLADGAVVSEAVVGAVEAASAFVAAGGAGAFELGIRGRTSSVPAAPLREAEAVVAATRSAAGTVVATGGCFDVLHAGHVALLEGARSLGDCLVVCINSDESVRRLKGPERPRSPQDDRVAVLSALQCVDAVAVFDEDTPAEVLERLRPDVWVKGGDYGGAELPEAEALSRWGGQAIVLPYLAGRSTSRLLKGALNHDA